MNLDLNINAFDPLQVDSLFSSGLTFNDVKQNITQKPYIGYYRFQKVAESAGKWMAIAAGITIVVAGIFLSLKIAVIFPPAIFIAIPILYLITGLVASISFHIGSMIGSKILDWIRSSEKAHQQFFDQFEGTATIEIQDLKYQPNRVLQKELIAKMNFDQLSFARHSLGETKFKELIWDIKTNQHNFWNSILNFTSYSKDTILKKLNTSGIKFMMKNSPMFARELRKQLKDVHNQEIQRLLHPFPLFEYSEDEQKKNNITFTFDKGNKIQTNKELLVDRSNYFKNSGLENSDEKEVFAQSYDDMSKLINALTSDILLLDKEQALNLMRIADKCDEDKLLKYIESYIINNISDFNNEEILELIKNYGKHLHLLIIVKDKQLCMMKLTEKNWSEIKEIAKRYQFPLLAKKCFDFALETIRQDLIRNWVLSSRSTNWLQECSEMGKLENSELINLLVRHISFQNFQVIFNFAKEQKNEKLLVACNNFIQLNPCDCLKLAKNEWIRSILMDLSETDYSKFSIGLGAKISIDSVRMVFELAQDKKDEKLLEASIAFIGKNIQKIKDEQLWTLEEIPDEILAILYPSKK